jgi:hypothetical protein
MSSKNPTCSHCGKPLTYQDCFACNGKGYDRQLTFLKKECEVCHGKGQLWRCEDEFKHIVEDFKAAHPDTGDALQPSKRRQTASADELPDWEPTPLHPIHPENPWHISVLNNDLPHLTAAPKRRVHRNILIDRHAIKK